MADQPHRFRWLTRSLLVLIGILGFWLISVHRSANRRFSAALSRVERSNSPLTLDSLASAQNRGGNSADEKLRFLFPRLDKIEGQIYQSYDENGMTEEGQAVMERVFAEQPSLLDETLQLSRSDSFWSHRRFDDLNDVRSESTEQVHARAYARFLTHVAFDAQSRGDSTTSVTAAVAILRLSNLLSHQPLLEDLRISYTLKGMALPLLDTAIRSSPMDESLLLETAEAINQRNANTVWEAMLDTERAVRITEYQNNATVFWFDVNARTELLELFEGARPDAAGNVAVKFAPSATVSGVVSTAQNGDFLTQLKTMNRIRSKIRVQEGRVLDLIKQVVGP